MTKNEALNVLVQIAELAQSKGILKLQEAVIAADAIKAFQVEPEVKVEDASAYEESTD